MFLHVTIYYQEILFAQIMEDDVIEIFPGY